MTAAHPATQQETHTKAGIHHTEEIHTPNALPAVHPVMTDTVRNADTPTLIRDGLGKTINAS